MNLSARKLPRQRKRATGRLVLGVLMLGSGLTATTSASKASPAVSHVAPDTGTAGDDLVLATRVVPSCVTEPCAPPTVTVRYAKPDGTIGEVTGEGTSVGEQIVNVTVPGDAVRFPELSYTVAATLGGTGGASTVPVFARDYRVPVDNIIRVGFKRPDGSPVAGVTVFASPQRNGALWKVDTNDEGLAELRVPSDDPRIVERQAHQRFENVFLSAFDAWPSDTLAPGEERTISGAGTEVGVVVNLGEALLDAADQTVQDEVFSLRPQQRSFTAADPECQALIGAGYACVRQVGPLLPADLPLETTVGGGSQMTSEYSYTNSVFTRTSVQYSTGDEFGWTSAEGEVKSENDKSGKAETAAPVGPNANQTFFAQWNFIREEKRMCPYEGASYCSRPVETVRPYEWTTGFYAQASPGKHDLARSLTGLAGSDCVVRSDGRFTSSVSEGESRSFNVSVGGEGGVPGAV